MFLWEVLLLRISLEACDLSNDSIIAMLYLEGLFKCPTAVSTQSEY